ncbi:MAG: hypothetical protein ACRDTI_10795 [Mycobacterium sp.]
MEQITNVRSIELTNGESLTDVDVAELTEGGLLKVYSRATVNLGQVTLKKVSVFPVHAWQRINLDLYTLLVHRSDHATEALIGLDRSTIQSEIASRLIADGVPEKNAQEHAWKIAWGNEEINDHAGKSMYVFQRFG